MVIIASRGKLKLVARETFAASRQEVLTVLIFVAAAGVVDMRIFVDL
jgi:hypothetical protein